MLRRGLIIVLAVGAAGCSSVAQLPPSRQSKPSPSPQASPSPAPNYPDYYIESLRARPRQAGAITVGQEMTRGSGYTKYEMSWMGAGAHMTGTISVPDGNGPFPVVLVNHGHIPVERYWEGQDSGIFGDPMAAHGFISLAPNYPGYIGSAPKDDSVPDIIFTTETVMDLVSSLASLPKADPSRVAMIGHSYGGGVTLLEQVIDPRVKAVALYAPISSDMADNGRKWWRRGVGLGPLSTPDVNPDGYFHVSPRNYFAADQAPAIFLQGTSDQDIPADWTNASLTAMRQKGLRTDIKWYPGAMHDLVGEDLASANASAEAWIRGVLSPSG